MTRRTQGIVATPATSEGQVDGARSYGWKKEYVRLGVSELRRLRQFERTPIHLSGRGPTHH